MIVAVIGFGIAGEFGGQINNKNMLLVTAQLTYDYSIYSATMMIICLMAAHMIERAVYLRVGLDNCLNVARDVTIQRFDDDQAMKRFEKDTRVIERQRAEMNAKKEPEGAQELIEEIPPAIYKLQSKKWFSSTFQSENAMLLTIIVCAEYTLIAVLNGFLLAQWLTLPLPIISVLLYIGVIVGNKKESPNLYLPYIIINTIVILFILGVSVFVILTGASVTSLGVMTTDNTKEKQAFGMFGAFTITFGVIFFLWGLISAYFINVVYRAYRYLKDVVLLNPPPVVLPHEPAPVV
ncbi:hypothetical protein M3Y98_00650900 [Aphelenchoides besseyi]|nr:hypothetical protein M3Y98_00650900 [Aphelenchoides besseyi]